jgi:murein L,D-transpeptidase YafK
VRALLASAALAAALALAACDTDSIAPSARSLQPLSPQMISDIEKKNMAKESPILVRLFKEESELEVWKQDNNGRYALLKTYPICRWSGELGPKVKMGDRQAPEGFYTITPGLMNPNSNYYLAINTGFPNAYDRANGRTGDLLMIHGDCSSAGCYAMTDEQIAEIYSLARESFFGGQRAFQIQAYPFKMTPLNMARHRNSPHMDFWRMLKEGYDHFEVTRQEPKVDVCEKRYVFDAESNTKFSPAAKCPVYKLPDDLVAAVQEKQQRDETQMAELVSRGTPTVPVKMGLDGGMNPVFVAALAAPHVDSAGVIRSPMVSVPGTIPSHVQPPGAAAGRSIVAVNPDSPTGSVSSMFSLASTESKPAPAPTPAPAASSGGSSSLFSGLFSSGEGSQSSGGLFDRASKMVGLRGSEQPTEPAPKAKPAPKTVTASAGAIRPKPIQPSQQADAKGATKPAAKAEGTKVEANAAPPGSQEPGVMPGAQPTLPTGGFENRFGGWQR